jgi:3-oxoacyl-[acyl-carrier-protein] synthase-3
VVNFSFLMSIRSFIEASFSYIPEEMVSTEELLKTPLYSHKEKRFKEHDPKDIADTIGVDDRFHSRLPLHEMIAKGVNRLFEESTTKREEITHVIVAHNRAPNGENIPNVTSRVCSLTGLEHAISPDSIYGCHGDVFAMDVADSLIRTKKAKKVLVIGAEKLYEIRGDSIASALFSDGAAGVVISEEFIPDIIADNKIIPLPGPVRGIISSAYLADNSPKANDAIRMSCNFGNNERSLDMNGKDVYNIAVPGMAGRYFELLNKTNLNDKDIDMLLIHQASSKMVWGTIEKIMNQLHPDVKHKNDVTNLIREYISLKAPVSVRHLGNNSGATTLTLLDLILKKDTQFKPELYNPLLKPLMEDLDHYIIRPNDKIVFAKGGAGMGLAAMLHVMHPIYWDKLRN